MALEYFNTLKNNKKIIHFVLEDIIIGKIVASFSLQSIDSKFYSAELARTIGNAKYLNIGLGTSMTKFLINYAFNKTSIEFIWVGNNYKNISAIISNKKNGFIEMK